MTKQESKFVHRRDLWVMTAHPLGGRRKKIGAVAIVVAATVAVAFSTSVVAAFVVSVVVEARR